MMRWKTDWVKYRLYFNFEARTSRQVMTYKDTYFVRVRDLENPEIFGIGEANLFAGLSADDTPDFEEKLDEACQGDFFDKDWIYCDSPTIRFGLETAMNNLFIKLFPDRMIPNPGDREAQWIEGKMPIIINGLVWMGDQKTMARRINEKLNQGFHCIKLKIGGINFDEELALLDYIRCQYPREMVELRLDANGAFDSKDALEKLKRLSEYDIHSIEQPIKSGNLEKMAELCRRSPIPIALDEELIGLHSDREKEFMLDEIKPRYIVLKPALVGGIRESAHWIEAAVHRGIEWWATSALESNVGLEAIARWVYSRWNPLPQGLGTGQLYTNNIPSPLFVEGEGLWHDPEKKFDYGVIGFPD